MATVCGVNKIDSNVSGLAIAEEDCIKILPGVDGADAKWFNAEPNSYGSFGSETTKKAREPLNRSRQKRKGSVVDLDANGDFNTDITHSNLTRLMQGFCFADAREQASTAPINGLQIPITSVDATDGYMAASGLTIFAPGDIVHASGFGVPTNNGVKVVLTASATAVDTSNAIAAETTPPADAKLVLVGKVAAIGDLSITFGSGVLRLTSTAGAVPFANAIPGTWVFIGGDVVNSAFANNVGYARIKSATASALTFDQSTFTPVTESGAGKTIQIYAGTIVRNEQDPALIKRRSYQLERTLGEDQTGTQAEYLIGAVPNTLTINAPLAELFTADMAFVGCDVETRTGLQGLKVGTRVPATGDEAYNTTSDIYRSKLAIHNATDPNSANLFGYVTESTVEIDNGVTPSKGHGVLGAFDMSAGDFSVSGSITAYFTTVEAVRAIRENADVGFYEIVASQNAGLIYDIPLLTLSGGMSNVEKDSPIMIPVDHAAAESEFGNTLLFEFFDYLPNLAMPLQV